MNTRISMGLGKLTHFLKGCKLGGGVLYRIFVTASSVLLDLGRSIAGKGGGRALCDCL